MSRAVDVNDMLIFAQVAESESFSGAARVLGMPKSTVSRRVSELEEALGIRLVKPHSHSPGPSNEREML